MKVSALSDDSYSDEIKNKQNNQFVQRQLWQKITGTCLINYTYIISHKGNKLWSWHSVHYELGNPVNYNIGPVKEECFSNMKTVTHRLIFTPI